MAVWLNHSDREYIDEFKSIFIATTKQKAY